MEDGIRTLVVHLDGPDGAAARLRLARQVALDHGADISVVFALALPAMTLPVGPGAAYMVQALVDLEEQRRAGARAAFDDVLGTTSGVRAGFIDAGGGDATRDVSLHGMYADLLVIGQHDAAQDAVGGVPRDFPERVLMRSGRPVIVVPHAGPPPSALKTALVAWKETPEAARAVRAALPVLRRAARVHVVSWGSQRPAPSRDLRRYLLAHGIEAEWHEGGRDDPQEVGDLLLSRAADLSADLLVMGCYGHSRAREWIRGGASRTVLKSMTLPVLMAH